MEIVKNVQPSSELIQCECYNSHENTSLPLGPTAPSTVQNLYILMKVEEIKKLYLLTQDCYKCGVFFMNAYIHHIWQENK